MAVTFSLDQPYPVPGLVPVKFSLSGAGNFVRIWLTDAPDGSELKNKLDGVTDTARLLVFEGGSEDIWNAPLDKSGAFVFITQEYTRVASTYGGGYARDPNSYPTETLVGSERPNEKIYVGERLLHRLGAHEYGFADLVVWVWNDTIRKTTVLNHGESTPAIISPTNPRALAAVKNTTVEATVATFIDATASSLLTNLASVLSDFRTTWTKHFNNSPSGFHGAADTDNDTAVEDIPADPSTPKGYAHAARVVAQRLTLHMTNGSDNSAGYHSQPDYTNALIAPISSSANDMPSIWASVADTYRAYEAHRADATAHPIADGTNTLSATLDPLLLLHRDFLAALQVLSPTAPASANSAATLLLHWGFRR